ncbi:MAG: hypothetical protein IT536_20440 [Hyphomicrobiales bacterium]|nr:hypothetical protein [Hyphomicrobiales bacterium]
MALESNSGAKRIEPFFDIVDHRGSLANPGLTGQSILFQKGLAKDVRGPVPRKALRRWRARQA